MASRMTLRKFYNLSQPSSRPQLACEPEFALLVRMFDLLERPDGRFCHRESPILVICLPACYSAVSAATPLIRASDAQPASDATGRLIAALCVRRAAGRDTATPWAPATSVAGLAC